jgi:hypothetical protein
MAVNAEVFPVRSVRRVVQVISVFVVDGEEMAHLVIKLPSASGTDETMDIERSFTVIAFSKRGLFQFPDDFFNGLGGIRLFSLLISMDSIRSFSHRNDLLNLFAYTRVLFTPLEIMPHLVSSPAMAGLEFLTG